MIDIATPAAMRGLAASLHLHGLIERWAEARAQPEQARWMAQILGWEVAERSGRRLSETHIGRFKPLGHPRLGVAFEELMTLAFVKDASNVVWSAPKVWASRDQLKNQFLQPHQRTSTVPDQRSHQGLVDQAVYYCSRQYMRSGMPLGGRPTRPLRGNGGAMAAFGRDLSLRLSFFKRHSTLAKLG